MPERATAERPPGTVRPRRFRPTLHYELIVCGLRGHELVGTEVRELRPEDRLVAFEDDGVRWHRCLRCDSWLPLPPPARPVAQHLPPRDQIELPPRGKPLRDKIVLRVIAVDRAFHFLVLGLLAILILVFASNQADLHKQFVRVITDLQSGVGGGPVQTSHVGIVHDLDKLFSLKSSTLHLLAAGVLAYAVLEGVEAVGLWFQKRWAEYLTFVATTLFLPLEVYELTHKLSPLKIFAFVVNVAIVVYLLLAKRLFGLRGGGAAEEAERERDVGWEAIERAAPGHLRTAEGGGAAPPAVSGAAPSGGPGPR
jgi:uncharacterized membrane protein (DUF2068 family)